MIERREDMLSYTTEPFKEPFTITGELAVKLYVSCDCPDTDFMVRITDVDETGRSIKLADGVLCAKYRNGFEQAEYLRPDQIYPVTIRTTKISNTFLPGHSLRLTVTSSGKNFIFPNSNTEDGFDSTSYGKSPCHGTPGSTDAVRSGDDEREGLRERTGRFGEKWVLFRR